MFEEVKELLISFLTSDFSDSTEKNRKRKIIFWYDAKQDYKDLIAELNLENTEIIKYDNNSLWIRYYLEKEELDKNIILYLPFERKNATNNELLDIEIANSDLIFNPDSTTMRLKNLQLKEECRNVIKKYTRFFNNKTRESDFKEFDIEEKNSDNIDYIITAILLGIKSINIDEMIKSMIKIYYEDTQKYEALFKFGNQEFILQLINGYFGCNITSPEELEFVCRALIFTYFATSIQDINKLNRYGKYLLLNKITNSQVFVNSLMRDKDTKKYFELVSNSIISEFGINELLDTMPIEEYKNSDAFCIIDEKILSYISNQLLEDINEFNKYNELIQLRESKYWYMKYYNEYNFLKTVNQYFAVVNRAQTLLKTLEIEEFVELYSNELYLVDTLYRKMYHYFDHINDRDNFINLKNKVENNYNNTYMFEMSLKWTNIIENLNRYDSNKLTMQNKFFDQYIKPQAESTRNGRTIVIISDAFRFECAKELNEKLKIFSTKSQISYMLGLVPSYTGLGIASLLPNKKLERDANNKESDTIYVDGINSSSTQDRQKILQKVIPEGLAIQYEALYGMTKSEWKKEFSGKKVVYIYHDVIDKSGEHNENEVFEACEKAITQIEKLVKDLHTTFSGINCFITADHGFFYKRSKVEKYQKTEKAESATKQKKRYSYADNQSVKDGILSINLDYIFGANSGYVNIPKGQNVFLKQGGGLNYIHGGVLPQEVIIPVIEFKSTRKSEETQKVGITYTGLSIKITNAITYLEFLQDNKVDENNLPGRYLLHFEDEAGVRVSDECTIVANYTNPEVKNRFFKEKFVFKNMNYDPEKSYYLVIIDEETGIEKQKIKFMIDIAIINKFTF